MKELKLSLVEHSLFEVEFCLKIHCKQIIEGHVVSVASEDHKPLNVHNDRGVPVSGRRTLTLHEKYVARARRGHIGFLI